MSDLCSAAQYPLCQAEQSLVMISSNTLVQAIKEFRAHCSSLQIQLYDEKVATILQLVQAGKLDMGLGTFGSATPFLRSPLVVIRPDEGPRFAERPPPGQLYEMRR